MQIQHQARLLEPTQLRAEDLNGPGRSHQWSHASKCLDYYVLLNQCNSLNAIEHMASSPVANILAVLISQLNQIYLFDTRTQAKLERFPLKPCDKKFSRESFQVSGIDFSPDGQRLAVGQTDCIVYIYKLPNYLISSAGSIQQSTQQATVSSTSTKAAQESTKAETNRITISGKYSSSSPITCLIWTEIGIIYGGQDGKVRLIASHLKSTLDAQQNRAIMIICARNSTPISLAFKWPMLAVSFIDSSIELLVVTSNEDSSAALDLLISAESLQRGSTISNQQLNGGTNFNRLERLQASSLATCLLVFQPLQSSSILSICFAGSDGQISLLEYQNSTQLKSSEFELKQEVQSMDYCQVDEVLAVLTNNRLYFIKYEPHDDRSDASWRLQGSYIELSNVHCMTRVTWMRDGTQLALGGSSGLVELFSCSWSKQSIDEQLDICSIAKNRVRITDRARNLLATYKTPSDIKRVNLLDEGRSVIIWTQTNSVLLARLGQWSSAQQSLISLPHGIASNQRHLDENKRLVQFHFEPSGFVFVFLAASRELQLFKLGETNPAYTVKLLSTNGEHQSTVELSLLAARLWPWPRQISSQRLSSVDNLSPTSRMRLDNERANSAKSQPDQQLSLSTSSKPTAAATSQMALTLQLFAFVQEEYKLSVINLNSRNKIQIFYKEYSHHRTQSIQFSHTGRYLIVQRSISEGGQLDLVEFYSNTFDGTEEGFRINDRILTRSSHHFAWIPGTDCLVIQQHHKLLVCYDLEQPIRRAEKVDLLSLNPNLQPADIQQMIDLSFVGTPKDYKIKVPTITRVTQDEVYLSNNRIVQLDKNQVSYRAELANRNLVEAANLLLNQASQIEKNQMVKRNLSDIGWLAIRCGDCQLANRIFSRLAHRSLCDYLTKCMQLEEQPERSLMLAKLCGDWDKFESLAENSEVIIMSYRRMNKWLRLIDYLGKSQQFRQRDMAERDMIGWFLRKGRRLDAANRLATSSGQLAEAVELLLECDESSGDIKQNLKKQILEASRMLLSTSAQLSSGQLKSLARRVYDLDLEYDLFSNAAQLAEVILDEPHEALDLYVRAKDYKAALTLAKKLEANTAVDKKKIDDIKLTFASHLEQLYSSGSIGERRVIAAIDYYANGGDLIAALELARKLEAVDKIEYLLRLIASDDTLIDSNQMLAMQCRQIGHFLTKKNKYVLAEQAFELTNDNEQVVQLLLDTDQVDRAYQVSLERVHSNDRTKTMAYFDKFAKQLIESASKFSIDTNEVELKKQLKKAEIIYVQLLEKPETAVEMLKKFELWDEALALIEQHQPDQLEASLFQLARNFEARNQLEEAEKCLLRASPSEWTNVVRMYRLAERWQDAFRVASANCISEQDPLMVQLAYWWAKSIVLPQTVSDGDRQDKLKEARDLLDNQLSLFKQVVEFCCDAKNFQFALDLCSTSRDQSLKREVSIRFANLLELQQKFEKAEQVLIENDLIEQAIRMYVDNDRLQDAVSLAERKLSEMNETDKDGSQTSVLRNRLQEALVDCAQRIANESWPSCQKNTALRGNSQLSAKDKQKLERLAQAQQLFLRAQRPELAIEMYQKRGLWIEAVQVAQRFAPRLVEKVEQALDEQVHSDLGPIMQQQQQAVLTGSNGSVSHSVTELETRIEPIGSPATEEDETRKVDFVIGLIGRAKLLDQQAFSELEKVLTKILNFGNEVTGGAVIANYKEYFQGICSLAQVLLNKHSATLNHIKQLRSILLSSCKLINLHQAQQDSIERRVPFGCRLNGDETSVERLTEQYTLVVHFYYLQLSLQLGCLQQKQKDDDRHLSIALIERIFSRQPTNSSARSKCLNLLGKLSFCLLRYAGDYLVPHQALFTAGIWQLAVGRRRLARHCFSYLVELAEQANQNESIGLMAASEWRSELNELVDMPAELHLENTDLIDGQRLANEARQWLLETLLEGELLNDNESHSRIDARLTSSGAVCLLSALPLVGQTETLGQSSNHTFSVRTDEWNMISKLITKNQGSEQKIAEDVLAEIKESLIMMAG